MFKEVEMKYLAQFNKVSKVVITVMDYVDPETLNNDDYLYIPVDMDIEAESVVGTYDNYKIVKKTEQPVEVVEPVLNDIASTKITERYPLWKQLNVLTEALSKSLDYEDHPELHEMKSFIEEVRRTNGLRKSFYEESPDHVYLKEDDIIEQDSLMDAGGINEKVALKDQEEMDNV